MTPEYIKHLIFRLAEETAENEDIGLMDAYFQILKCAHDLYSLPERARPLDEDNFSLFNYPIVYSNQERECLRDTDIQNISPEDLIRHAHLRENSNRIVENDNSTIDTEITENIDRS